MTDSLQIAHAAVRLYAESHPRPPHVTQSQAALMMDVSRPTIARMIKARVLRLNDCGMIPISEIDRALSARQDEQQARSRTGCSM